MRTSLVRCALALLAALMILPVWTSADETIVVDGKKVVIHDKVVDLFDGMESGELEVRLIPRDSREANVLIVNKTDQPVTVKLPEAFAGVPALRQVLGGGLGGGGLGGGGLGGGGFGGGGLGGGGFGGGGGGNQGVGGGFGGGGLGGGGFGGGGLGGGGFGGGGLGGGGFGGGGGLFNVAPEKVGKIKVTTVCLEHGLDDPNPRLKYTIVPIEKFTDKPEVIELCKMVGRGEIPQNTAQAAAWHLANGMSWQELAHKDRVYSSLTGYREKYFSPRELQFALNVVAESNRRADLLASRRNAAETSQNPLIGSQRQD